MKNNKTNKKKKIEKILLLFFFVIVTLFIISQSSISPLKINEISGTDSSVFKTIALYMQKGMMPYKDIFDHKGPLLYFYNYIGNQLSYYKGILIVEFISMFITIFYSYKVARLYAKKELSVIIVVLYSVLLSEYFDGGNLTEEYALPFISISLFIFLKYLKDSKVTNLEICMIGFCFGAILLLRPNMIALWVVYCLIILIKCIKGKKYKELLRYIAYFIIGIAIILIPFMIWILLTNSLNDFIECYLRFNFMYSSDPNRSGLISKIRALINFANNKVLLIILIIDIYLVFREKNMNNIGNLLFYIFSLIFVSMSGQIYPHYGMVLVPTIIYPLSVIVLKKYNKDPILIKAVYVYLFITLCIPTILNITSNNLKEFEIKMANKANNLYSISTEEKIANYIIDNSEENDMISVYGNYNIIYVLSHRLSASKYSFQSPIGDINSKIYDDYFRDINDNIPKFIIVNINDERINDYIQNNDFVNVEQISNDDIKVYKHKIIKNVKKNNIKKEGR